MRVFINWGKGRDFFEGIIAERCLNQLEMKFSLGFNGLMFREAIEGLGRRTMLEIFGKPAFAPDHDATTQVCLCASL